VTKGVLARIEALAVSVVFDWQRACLVFTHTALTSVPRIDFATSQSPFARLIAGLLNFFAETYTSVFYMPDPPLHDPCALMYILHPELFTVKVRVS
jgi:pyrimidine-specific ribonucleoside hydrolase